MPTAEDRRQIRAIVGGLERLSERAVIGISLDVTANLKQDPHNSDTGTPVDTGWARANWVPSVGQPVTEPVGTQDNPSAAADAQAAGEARVAGYRLRDGKAFVSNNVPYILSLNEGHSPQQSAGFVQRAIRAALVDERGAQAQVHRTGMTGAIECRYYGRDFTAEEMALLRSLIAGPPALNRHALSKEFCRRIGWLKTDGRLKDMMARVTMLAMHRDGVIALPAPRGKQGRAKPIVFGPHTEPPLFPAPTTLDEVRPLDFRTVVRETREGRLWNEFVARYHYLGYKTLVGAQIRYAVHDRNGWPLAMLGFSTAAWRLAPRDRFIGWTPQMREKNLPLVIDNPRFLILPRIELPNLGSHILALVRRRLPTDWTERYNTTPVLIETFVETPRRARAQRHRDRTRR